MTDDHERTVECRKRSLDNVNGVHIQMVGRLANNNRH